MPFYMDAREFISDGYREQLRTMAWGGGGQNYAEEVRYLAKKLRAETVLDYGCGPGTLKKELEPVCPGLFITEYDPGVDGKDALPDPADIVVCVDVLEHVEPDKIGAVIRHLYDLTNRAAIVSVATRPAEKRLPDGRNAHLIIDNAVWWRDQFAAFDWSMYIQRVSKMAGEFKLWLIKK